MYNTYTTSKFYSSTGKALRKIRVRIYDMSQADFAKHILHCSQPTLSQMELGKIGLSKEAEKLVGEYSI